MFQGCLEDGLGDSKAMDSLGLVLLARLVFVRASELQDGQERKVCDSCDLALLYVPQSPITKRLA
jgi:hypothetical protein